VSAYVIGVSRELLRDPTITQARIQEDVESVDDHGFLTQTKAEEMKENLQMLRELDQDSQDEMKNTVPFFSLKDPSPFPLSGVSASSVDRSSAVL